MGYIESMKTYKAIIHFNKSSSRLGKPWTIHYRNTCYIVSEINCNVPIKSEFKPNKKTNPRAFFTAQVTNLIINNNIATLT